MEVFSCKLFERDYSSWFLHNNEDHLIAKQLDGYSKEDCIKKGLIFFLKNMRDVL